MANLSIAFGSDDAHYLRKAQNTVGPIFGDKNASTLARLGLFKISSMTREELIQLSDEYETKERKRLKK